MGGPITFMARNDTDTDVPRVIKGDVLALCHATVVFAGWVFVMCILWEGSSDCPSFYN